MFEGDFLLTVGVGNFLVVLPLAQQERLAAYFRSHFDDAVHMAFFHGEDDIGLLQMFASQLPAFMVGEIAAMFAQYCQRGAVHGFVYQRAEARRTDVDAAMGQSAFKQGFDGGAAADVADAYDQDFMEHMGCAGCDIEGDDRTDSRKEGVEFLSNATVRLSPVHYCCRDHFKSVHFRGARGEGQGLAVTFCCCR